MDTDKPSAAKAALQYGENPKSPELTSSPKGDRKIDKGND
jgi:hypothetical protein